MQPIDKNSIIDRFFDCYSDLSHLQIAKEFAISRQTVDQWGRHESPVPWRKLKNLVNEQSISWDWLIDGYGAKNRTHIYPEEASRNPEFDRAGINTRFLSCFQGVTQNDVAERLGINRSFISAWRTNRKQVPWETLQYAVVHESLSWEWLIEGRDPKYRTL